MNTNIRPADMKRINTPELAEAFIAEQVAQVRAQLPPDEQLYDLAMISHKPLDPEAMTKFIARSNEIMMVLAK